MRTGLSASLRQELPLLLLACAGARAADLAPTPYFRTLGAADGLPSSEVRALAEDRDGFIWIGTVDGLARYDGVGFRVFRHDPADARSIAGNDVSALFIDRDDRLWCGGEDSGLNLLAAPRSGFAHFRHDPSDPRSLGTNDVWAITQSADGAIWAGGYGGGVDRLDADGTGFVHFRHADGVAGSLVSDNVISLFGDSRGRVWIGTDIGIDVLDVDGGLRHVDMSTAVAPGTPVNVDKLIAGADGAVLAGTRVGVLRVDAALRATVFADARLADRVVFSLLRDADDSLWIGTRGGLHRRRSAGQMDVYTENAALPGGLPANAVFDALRDHEGGLWFALRESGIARLSPRWREFGLFRHDPENRASLSANPVRGMDADTAGRIWVVNWGGGIDRLDPASGNVERWAGRLPAPDKALSSVLDDRRGRLWIGYARGLRVYETRTGTFSDLAVDPRRRDALARGDVRQLLLGDDAGVVWALARGGGMHRIDIATRRIERFDEAAGTLRNADINQFARGPRGDVLVGGAAGVDRFEADERAFKPLAGAPEQRVDALAFAGDGTLWLHVLGALEHYRLDRGAATLLQRFDATDGWPAQTVTGLVVDAQGVLWVGSARGLWRVDPATRALRVYDGRGDLASGEFTGAAFVRRNDGAVFGGTLAGVVAFDPLRLVERAAPPRLKLDAAMVARDGRDFAFDTAAPSIALDWNDRNLRFTARALSFASPSASRYQWQLAGYDGGWIDTGNRGEREFSQLAPGDYRLRVRVASASGVWSEPLAVPIAVSSPPWATRWAYAAYALASALFAWLAVRAWRARLDRRHAYSLAQQQRRFAEQANAAKTEFLATMGHEIRTPMTGVLGMTELLLRSPLDATQRRHAEAIWNSGRVLLRLVNDSLDLARIEAGKLDLEDAPLDLHRLLLDIETLERPAAEAKGLTWTLGIAADVPHHVRGDAARVEQILLNLVNNAIKFSEHGGVSLDAQRVSAGIEFCVRDSGPGVSEALRARLFQRFEQAQGPQRRAGSGLGLAICRELAARMGGSIALDCAVAQGSTFRVTLPLAETPMPLPETLRTPPRAPVSAACSVLLVEDDATVAAVITGLLEAMDHRVVHVAHGLAALAELETSSFDAALIDLDLPGIDGLALARLLRARETPDARRPTLIGVSARSVGDEEPLCLDAGMDAFVRKPVTAQMLADALRRTAG